MEKANFKSLSPKVIGPRESFCTLVDQALLAKAEKEKEGKGYYPLRPSSAGYCARKLAYDLSAWMGYSEKVWEFRKPSVIRLLNLGHSIEYQALKELNEIPGFDVKFKQQIVEMFKLPSGRIIEGSVDSVMWSEEHKALLDVKSVGLRWHSAFGNTWEALKAKYDKMKSMYRFDENAWYVEDPMAFLDEIGEDSLVANICQVNLYACTQFMKDRGVSVGVIYRYCKSNSETMEIRFKPSEQLFEKIRVKYSVIEEKVMEKKPEEVKKEFSLGSQACAFCPYQSRCWPETDAKKSYFKTFPKKEWPDKLEAGSELVELFQDLSELERAQDDKVTLEAKLLTMMEEQGLDKVQLPDGSIYKRVFLKSPKPHYELRRSHE